MVHCKKTTSLKVVELVTIVHVEGLNEEGVEQGLQLSFVEELAKFVDCFGLNV